MIITITALKGGVGKTTTSIHLAAYLQQHAPTLLIDADRNRSALVWSREDKLPFTVASQAGATAIISKYTHIITDTQARPEQDELKDLVASSDLLIVPTTPNHLDIDTTLKTTELLEAWGAKYKILLTQVDSRTKTGRAARAILAEAKLPLFNTDIPLLVAFERSSSRGMTIADYPDPRSQFGWSKYQAVGQEVLG
ncbi:AAA family ATPase [Chamaesiphon sp.]|uniref:nucleotide-binding protein n=1 Tax=Chamaesiphon sp. TaxID=2814140 RepID=UPI00359343D1